MPIKYYPSSRIKPNLYTRGDEYVLPTGEAYRGKYYLTYGGEAYTGINPVTGTNILLLRIGSSNSTAEANILVNRGISVVDVGGADRYRAVDTSDQLLTELVPYNPFPISDDYAQGYFTRYFAKTVSGPGYVLEISPADFAKIENGQIADNVLGYESTSMIWQLTGPLNDTRISQYQIKGGVFTTNKRVTEGKAAGFVGLLNFIGGDYTKFARITPDVATTGSL
jgi:hypothetical protein